MYLFESLAPAMSIVFMSLATSWKWWVNLVELFFQGELVTDPSRSYSFKMINMATPTLVLWQA